MTVKLNTRIVIMTNEVPRFSDSSNALAGRCLTLQTRRSFYGKEDTGLTERLLAELPGILNWALEGQRRLRQRGAFKQPKSSEELVQQLEELGSPMTCFVRECCEVMSGARVPSDELYQAWVGWCQREGRDHCGTKSTFGRDLLAAVATVKSRRDTTQRVFYDGICLSSASKPRRWINVSNGLAFFIHCVSDGGRGKSRVIVRGGGGEGVRNVKNVPNCGSLWVTVGTVAIVSSREKEGSEVCGRGNGGTGESGAGHTHQSTKQ